MWRLAIDVVLGNVPPSLSHTHRERKREKERERKRERERRRDREERGQHVSNAFPYT
jgi:hypothetical protein